MYVHAQVGLHQIALSIGRSRQKELGIKGSTSNSSELSMSAQRYATLQHQ